MAHVGHGAGRGVGKGAAEAAAAAAHVDLWLMTPHAEPPAATHIKWYVQDMEPGEAWAKGLQKLQLLHRQDGPLGSIYLDLHPRCWTAAALRKTGRMRTWMRTGAELHATPIVLL